VAEAVVRAAREEGADYLVIGTEGRGALAQLVLGSTSHELLKHTPCPVLVVPTKGQKNI
jgi:nucleotide-binding universal stress UspA family protein